APEIAAGERALRSPWRGDARELLWVGKLIEPVRSFDGAADAEIAYGQHVGALELEHQEHVRAPDAEPLDRGQLRYHPLVGQSVQPRQFELAGEGVLGERAQVGDLGPREAGSRAQLFGLLAEDLLRRRRTAAEALGQP